VEGQPQNSKAAMRLPERSAGVWTPVEFFLRSCAEIDGTAFRRIDSLKVMSGQFLSVSQF
jgi:hypothetical protein